jgi:hypothetical protein
MLIAQPSSYILFMTDGAMDKGKEGENPKILHLYKMYRSKKIRKGYTVHRGGMD